MTRYDAPPASDGAGGPHPLANVPQAALDAAVAALATGLVELDDDHMIEPVAHAVLASALPIIRSHGRHPISRQDIEKAVYGADLLDRNAGGYGKDGWVDQPDVDNSAVVQLFVKMLRDMGITVGADGLNLYREDGS